MIAFHIGIGDFSVTRVNYPADHSSSLGHRSRVGAMSGKGKAFDKPNVNISHKLAVRRVAQLQAKQTFKSAAVQPSELEVLKDIINLSDMTSERQTD